MTEGFTMWIRKIQEIADRENLIIKATYFTLLDYLYNYKATPETALEEYKRVDIRMTAIQSDLQEHLSKKIVPKKENDSLE